MDDIAEILSDIDKIIVIQTGIIERLTHKLLEYIEIDEIEELCKAKMRLRRLKIDGNRDVFTNVRLIIRSKSTVF